MSGVQHHVAVRVLVGLQHLKAVGEMRHSPVACGAGGGQHPVTAQHVALSESTRCPAGDGGAVGGGRSGEFYGAEVHTDWEPCFVICQCSLLISMSVEMCHH